MARTKASVQARQEQDRFPMQLARRTYLQETLASRIPTETLGSFMRKRGRGARKVGRAEGGRRAVREERMAEGLFQEYHSMIVSARSVEVVTHSAEVTEEECALWEECAEYHLALASDGGDESGINNAYDIFLLHKIDEYERMALDVVRGDTSANDFDAVRRLLGILLQEREMLGLPPSQLAAIGFDGAFVATGRSVLARGFRSALGWYSRSELQARFCEDD